jgi:putative methyltransferase
MRLIQDITAHNESFLDAKPEQYQDVEYILLDPSCSGSGIASRMDHLLSENEASKERLEALAEFQIKAILHAFTFPNVKKVVYSTCSKYREENEDVVAKVLELNQKFKLAENVFPQWEGRGIKEYDQGNRLLINV